MRLTDEAANKTMDAVEEAVSVAADIGQHAGNLYKRWERIAAREQQPGEFKTFFVELGAFLPKLMEQADALNRLMTQALMAQDFQDLTGQVIKRVIQLVQDVEDNLVATIRMFGQMEDYRRSMDGEQEKNAAAEGPIMNADTRDDVVTSQDDVDDLLSSLGF
jgi:chemotaxis protein CheZ